MCFDSLLETSHHNFAAEPSPLNSRKSHLFSVFSFVVETFNTNNSGLENSNQLIVDKSFLKREELITLFQKDVILLAQVLEGKDVVGSVVFRPRYDLEKLSEASEVLSLLPRNMLASLGVSESFRETKVDEVNVGRLLVTNQEVVWLDVSVQIVA